MIGVFIEWSRWSGEFGFVVGVMLGYGCMFNGMVKENVRNDVL